MRAEKTGVANDDGDEVIYAFREPSQVPSLYKYAVRTRTSRTRVPLVFIGLERGCVIGRLAAGPLSLEQIDESRLFKTIAPPDVARSRGRFGELAEDDGCDFPGRRRDPAFACDSFTDEAAAGAEKRSGKGARGDDTRRRRTWRRSCFARVKLDQKQSHERGATAGPLSRVNRIFSAPLDRN